MADIQNYTLGMANLTFYEDPTGTGTSLKTWDIGNIVNCSVAPEVTFLEHYTVTNGTRKMNRSLITQKKLAINFTFDELTGWALKEFLLATVSTAAATASASGFTIYPMAKGEIKGCAKLEFTTEFGRDYEWHIPCAAFKPDGAIDFNAEDWMNAKGIIDVLVDESNSDAPFGRIVFMQSWSPEGSITG